MHPFAKYIQILGKGRNGMRSLTRDEAYEAMKMIACYDVEPEQIGAFMMLMRVKEETAEEVAGFAQALRESIPVSQNQVQPVIDWPAYAGKRRHLPWFLLSALVLAQQGYTVLMHGLYRTDKRIYVRDALDALDIEPANSLRDAQWRMKMQGFAYLPISKLSSLTADLISNRELFGLRPPLHTVARMLNPLSAPLSVMGVFHPNYAEIHQHAAKFLGQPGALVCKGEGGEFERIPDRSVTMYRSLSSELQNVEWQQMIKTGSEVKPKHLNLRHFRAVWEGEAEDNYGHAAVIGTLAMIIYTLAIVETAEQAHELAEGWWLARFIEQPMREAV